MEQVLQLPGVTLNRPDLLTGTRSGIASAKPILGDTLAGVVSEGRDESIWKKRG
jgi:hypothetical protein